MTNKTDTETLIKALRILVEDIQSEDGVANACIAEAADRLEELHKRTVWRYISEAPLGSHKKVKTKDGEREVFKPDWIYTSQESTGHATMSHWIPKEERWNGYTKESPPTHFFVLPTPPQNKE